MTKNTNIPIVNPTDTEKTIWQYIRPRKTGGVVRQGSTRFPDQMLPYECGPTDKANPEHWDDKMKGGPRAEWWAYMMEGAHRVLDVGCGFGFPSFYLASCGYEVVGVDASPSQIAAAEWYRQQEGPSYRLEFQVIEQTVLPFEDDSFDGAAFSSSLECVGEPETMMREVIRVLKPGSPVAIDIEGKPAQPTTHPVWEQRKFNVIDGIVYLRVDMRVYEPYLDRRYMIPLKVDSELARRLCSQAPTDVFRWDISLEEAGVSIEQALSEADEGEYGEARGYSASTLSDFLEEMGFTELKSWIHNDGEKFAEVLQRTGVLAEMPDDIRAVSRALVESLYPWSTPTGLVSCKSP